MSKHRVMVLAAAAALLLPVAAECGGSREAPGAVSAAAEKAKPTLKYVIVNAAFDPAQDPAKKVFEERTGYKLEVFMLPAEKPLEKLNIDLASGTEYDILNISRSWYDNLVANKVLIPLDRLLDQYGANIKAAIGAETWLCTTQDGAIYGVPKRNPMDTVNDALGVRGDWLDEMGRRVPQTLEEFTAALKAFQDAKKVLPLTAVAASGQIPTISSAFGVSTYWKDVGGTLVPRMKQPGFQEYVAYVAGLYKAGLLDNEMPVNKSENTNEKLTSGKAAVAPYSWGSAASLRPGLQKNFPKARIDIIHPLKGAAGQQEISLNKGLDAVAGIPRMSKHAEDAVKYMNACLDPKNFKALTIGEEGVHHTADNGKYAPLFPKFNEFANGNYFMNGMIEREYGAYWQARVRKNDDMYATFAEMMKSAPVGRTDPTAFAPSLDKVSKYLNSLKQMENDYIIMLIAGGESLSGYDKFLQDWDKAGGAEMVKQVNDWYRTARK